jgi:hypothetical protein
MAWQYNKKVNAVFTHHTSRWSWAHIGGIGWRRIRGGSRDGVTNMSIALAAAVANNRKVHVDIDSKKLITTMYLL